MSEALSQLPHPLAVVWRAPMDASRSLNEVNCVWRDAAMLRTRRPAHDMIDCHAGSRSTVAIDRRKKLAGSR